jgi:hypothetical protein
MSFINKTQVGLRTAKNAVGNFVYFIVDYPFPVLLCIQIVVIVIVQNGATFSVDRFIITSIAVTDYLLTAPEK